MTRIKQFADDLGISYKQAEKLIMASRKKKDKGQQAIDKRLEEMKRQQENADKIAADDANMVLKAKKGKSVDITGPLPRPKQKPSEINSNQPFDREAYEKALENERKLKDYMDSAPTQQAKLKRRGDDKKVVKAASGKYQSHGAGCGCDMCGGGEMVRGMGKAYMGNPRAAKIR